MVGSDVTVGVTSGGIVTIGVAVELEDWTGVQLARITISINPVMICLKVMDVFIMDLRKPVNACQSVTGMINFTGSDDALRRGRRLVCA